MSITIPQEAVPSPIGMGTTKAVYPDSVHSSSAETFIAEQTAALWVHNLGNRHSYQWESAQYSPRATIAAFDTWYDLKMPDRKTVPDLVQTQIPWLMQVASDSAGASGVRIREIGRAHV
jgi:hypothetical protein